MSVSQTHEILLVAANILREHQRIEATSLEDAVASLNLIAEIRKLTGQIKQDVDLLVIEITDDIADGRDHRIVELDDGTVVSVKRRPSKVVTDWGLLMPAAITAIDELRNVDIGTGEIMSFKDKVVQFLPQLVPATGSTQPKRAGVELLNLDIDRYQDKEWGGLSVRVDTSQKINTLEER